MSLFTCFKTPKGAGIKMLKVVSTVNYASTCQTAEQTTVNYVQKCSKSHIYQNNYSLAKFAQWVASVVLWHRAASFFSICNKIYFQGPDYSVWCVTFHRSTSIEVVALIRSALWPWRHRFWQPLEQLLGKRDVGALLFVLLQRKVTGVILG